MDRRKLKERKNMEGEDREKKRKWKKRTEK